MNISLEPEVPDHCCQIALSSDSREYSVAFLHSHDAAYAKCIKDITQAAGEVEFESEKSLHDIQ